MTDKEVGEKWRESFDENNRPYGYDGRDIIQALIRKLVEERKLHYMEEGENSETEAMRFSLRDFGINPDSFSAVRSADLSAAVDSRIGAAERK